MNRVAPSAGMRRPFAPLENLQTQRLLESEGLKKRRRDTAPVSSALQTQTSNAPVSGQGPANFFAHLPKDIVILTLTFSSTQDLAVLRTVHVTFKSHT